MKSTRVDDIDMNIDRETLQSLQDCFCSATNLYVTCMMKEQGLITDFSGSKTEEDYVQSHFSSSLQQELMNSFIDGTAENVVDYVGSDSYYIYKGVAIRDREGNLQGVFLCFGLASEELPEEIYVPSEICQISRKKADQAVSLLENLSRFFFIQHSKALDLRQQIAENFEGQQDMEYRLMKNEIMTDILRTMESDRTFSRIAEDIVRAAGQYIECSNALLLELALDDSSIEVVTEWTVEGGKALTDQWSQGALQDFPFFNGKPYTISSDATLPRDFAYFFSASSLTAGIFLPVEASGGSATMYLCFVSRENKRKWSVDDLRFANDIKRIIHSVLVKKITRNSLASSYAAMESILQNAGYGIAVTDPAQGSLLYTNSAYQDMFENEIDRLAVEELIFKPDNELKDISSFSANGSGRWYNISFSSIKWVDGKQVRLTTFYDITQQKNYQKKIEKQAREDMLTGLYNRQACEKDLQAQYRFAVSTDSQFDVLLIDLNDFSGINEGLGNMQGDLLLKYIAHSISDIPMVKDKCYRIGSDEFALIVDQDNIDRVDYLITRITSLFDHPWVIDGQEIYCSMNMAGIKVPADVPDYASILPRLSLTLDQGKKQGKNTSLFYSPQSEELALRSVKLEQALRKAVAADCLDFKVYYQPAFRLQQDTSVCCGAEALVRWDNPDFGIMSPGDFIPLAEDLGYMAVIGNHVMRQAAIDCKHWNDFGYPDYKVGINLSAGQFLSGDFVKQVQEIIEEIGLNPENMVFDITETMAVTDRDLLSGSLQALRKLGCKVALDDFGTGYSSLNYFKTMPIDIIKIDKSLVEELGQEDFAEVFVKSVSQLADTLGMQVCAEGVEKPGQQSLAGKYNVDLAQGYLFDKPLTQGDFENKYVN